MLYIAEFGSLRHCTMSPFSETRRFPKFQAEVKSSFESLPCSYMSLSSTITITSLGGYVSRTVALSTVGGREV